MNRKHVISNCAGWAWAVRHFRSFPDIPAKDLPVPDRHVPFAAANSNRCEIKHGLMNHFTAWQVHPAHASADELRTAKIHSWRRRALQRHGAQMRAAMGTDIRHCSLAMLDEAGTVVAWYDRANQNIPDRSCIVDRHVSQFYIAAGIAQDLPVRDLRAATLMGSNTREGWQCLPGCSATWCKIVIHPVRLRDGRLQGFSYLIHSSPEPSVQMISRPSRKLKMQTYMDMYASNLCSLRSEDRSTRCVKNGPINSPLSTA